MAMNKAEKAAFDKLEIEIRIARALRWSGAKLGEKLPVPASNEIVHGWDFNAFALSGTIFKVTTASVRHYGGEHLSKADMQNRSYSQGGRSLYPTERDALIALRLKKEREFARALASIDARIDGATP